jgi:L-lactate dehydrogenase complex protein LldG
VELHDIPPNTGYVGVSSDICEAFAAEANAVGGDARVVLDEADACRVLGELLRQYEPRTALCWQHPLLERLGLPRILASHGIVPFDYSNLAPLPPSERRERILAADIGITSCDRAIAETGSLVMHSAPGHERVASLLPPVHIAVIAQSQIVPDLLDIFSQLQAAGLEKLPSNITFITGPSKTGDIELQLTTGVHGPGKWHVIVIRETTNR